MKGQLLPSAITEAVAQVLPPRHMLLLLPSLALVINACRECCDVPDVTHLEMFTKPVLDCYHTIPDGITMITILIVNLLFSTA